MNAIAVRDSKFRQIIQQLSGYSLGWTREPTWRVKIEIGKSHFLSKAEYKTEKDAKAAAKRINDKGISL